MTTTMYPLAHQILNWTAGPGMYLFAVLILVGGFSGTAVGDPIPAIEGVALAGASLFLQRYAMTWSPAAQIVAAAMLLFWVDTFIAMQIRCFFAPAGYRFTEWSPIQVFQR